MRTGQSQQLGGLPGSWPAGVTGSWQAASASQWFEREGRRVQRNSNMLHAYWTWIFTYLNLLHLYSNIIKGHCNPHFTDGSNEA